ncbi:porin [Marinobacter sp.]|uniref:OprO/OprP family phosphate-selective porin n=1 Tax=Marinobacter sp. TaxID=50741 RepID=UPI001B78D100|nr:porin [Marinobacter sp.]MBQ0833148.1 porin [Marinobacter sp.]
MKINKTQLVLAISAALTTTTALADSDTEKLEKQLYELKNEFSELKKSSIFNLEFGGRVQVDYNYFEGAYNADKGGDPASDFFPRRIRTYVESEQGDWDHKLLLDFAEDSGEIVMARVRYSGFGNGLKVQVGKLREDISLNALTSSKYINTISRSSLANSMSPFFQWGASAYQYFNDTGFRYAVGVYKNEAFGANGRNDDDGSLALSLTGRLTWQKDLQNGVLHLGSWYSKRDMGGRVLTGALARGEVRNTNTRLVNYASGGNLVRLNSFQQAGLEAAYQYKGLTLEAEYAARELNTVDPASALDGERFDGFSLSASYFLGGQQKQYSKGSAVFKQPKGVENAWELVARLSNTDGTSDAQGTELTTYTLGTSYYYSSQIKLMSNLIYSEVDGPGVNDLVGGEDNGLGFTARIQYLF